MLFRIETGAGPLHEDYAYMREAVPVLFQMPLEFKPGLNIIYGPNGCGKSTLINYTAEFFQAFGGDRQLMTNIHSTFGTHGFFPRADPRAEHGSYADGFVPVHDGAPVAWHSAVVRPGSRYPGHFDDDFFSCSFESMQIQRRQSSGRAALTFLERIIQQVHEPASIKPFAFRGGPPLSVVSDSSGRAPVSGSETFAKLLQFVTEHRLGGSTPDCQRYISALSGGLVPESEHTGIPTILADEPECHMDLVLQGGFWRAVHAAHQKGLFDRVQLIIATHSPYALAVPFAHYIDIIPGFREDCWDTCAAAFLGDAPKSGDVFDRAFYQQTTKQQGEL